MSNDATVNLFGAVTSNVKRASQTSMFIPVSNRQINIRSLREDTT